jgi:hypothetical protein
MTKMPRGKRVGREPRRLRRRTGPSSPPYGGSGDVAGALLQRATLPERLTLVSDVFEPDGLQC